MKNVENRTTFSITLRMTYFEKSLSNGIRDSKLMELRVVNLAVSSMDQVDPFFEHYHVQEFS